MQRKVTLGVFLNTSRHFLHVLIFLVLILVLLIFFYTFHLDFARTLTFNHPIGITFKVVLQLPQSIVLSTPV